MHHGRSLGVGPDRGRHSDRGQHSSGAKPMIVRMFSLTNVQAEAWVE